MRLILRLSEDENYRENRRDAVEHATKIHETKLKSKDQHHKHAMDIAKHHHEHRVHEHDSIRETVKLHHEMTQPDIEKEVKNAAT